MPAEGSPAPSLRSLRRLRIALVLGVLVGLGVAQRLGIFEFFGQPAQVKQALLSLGPWGYAAFIGAYALLQPFGMPGMVFLLAAPLIWPWPVAFAVSLAGTQAASVVGFSFARLVGRSWVAGMIPERFRAHDEALAQRGFTTVFTLRLIFWMHPLLHAFFGVSRVPFWTHFWGSLTGYVPGLLATAYFGEKLFAALRAAPTWLWLALGAVALTVAAVVLVARRRRE